MSIPPSALVRSTSVCSVIRLAPSPSSSSSLPPLPTIGLPPYPFPVPPSSPDVDFALDDDVTPPPVGASPNTVAALGARYPAAAASSSSSLDDRWQPSQSQIEDEDVTAMDQDEDDCKQATTANDVEGYDDEDEEDARERRSRSDLQSAHEFVGLHPVLVESTVVGTSQQLEANRATIIESRTRPGGAFAVGDDLNQRGCLRRVYGDYISHDASWKVEQSRPVSTTKYFHRCLEIKRWYENTSDSFNSFILTWKEFAKNAIGAESRDEHDERAIWQRAYDKREELKDASCVFYNNLIVTLLDGANEQEKAEFAVLTGDRKKMHELVKHGLFAKSVGQVQRQLSANEASDRTSRLESLASSANFELHRLHRTTKIADEVFADAEHKSVYKALIKPIMDAQCDAALYIHNYCSNALAVNMYAGLPPQDQRNRSRINFTVALYHRYYEYTEDAAAVLAYVLGMHGDSINKSDVLAIACDYTRLLRSTADVVLDLQGLTASVFATSSEDKLRQTSRCMAIAFRCDAVQYGREFNMMATKLSLYDCNGINKYGECVERLAKRCNMLQMEIEHCSNLTQHSFASGAVAKRKRHAESFYAGSRSCIINSPSLSADAFPPRDIKLPSDIMGVETTETEIQLRVPSNVTAAVAASQAMQTALEASFDAASASTVAAKAIKTAATAMHTATRMAASTSAMKSKEIAKKATAASRAAAAAAAAGQAAQA